MNSFALDGEVATLAGVSSGVWGTDEANADAVIMAGESASLGSSASCRATGRVRERRFLWRETEGDARGRPRVKESLRGSGGGSIASVVSTVEELDALCDREIPGEDEEDEANVVVRARVVADSAAGLRSTADERRRISCCCEAMSRYFGRLMRARSDNDLTTSREWLPSTGRRFGGCKGVAGPWRRRNRTKTTATRTRSALWWSWSMF